MTSGGGGSGMIRQRSDQKYFFCPKSGFYSRFDTCAQKHLIGKNLHFYNFTIKKIIKCKTELMLVPLSSESIKSLIFCGYF